MKHIILYVILLVMLSSLVFGGTLLNTDPTIGIWLKLDDASGDFVDSKDNDLPNYDVGGSPGGSYQAAALANYSIYSFAFDNTAAGNSTAFLNEFILSTENITIAFWFGKPLYNVNEYLMGSGTTLDGFHVQARFGGGRFMWQVFPAGEGQVEVSVSTSPRGSLAVLRFNGTAYDIWINDTRGGTHASVNPLAYGAGSTHFALGNYRKAGDATQFDDRIDEVAIWNRSLTNDEIIEYYNFGITEILPPATSPPTIAPSSPADKAHNKTNVTLNATHDTVNNDVSYYLYLGENLPLDETDLLQNNVSRTGPEYRLFLTNITDGNYTYFWKVQNTTNGIFSANTTARNLVIDSVNPIITISDNTTINTNNLTIISNNITNYLWYNVSFFDPYLYRTLINITNEDGETMHFILNTSLNNKTTANYSRGIFISNWSIGTYILRLEASDSHTAQNWGEDVKVIKGLNYLRYRMPKGNDIKIKSDTFPLSKKTTRLKDRYDFEFNYLTLKEEYTYILETKNKLIYMEDSKYLAHFVSGKNWIDFNLDGYTNDDYVVKIIDDYTARITIKSKGSKNLKFSSIGGLNIEEKHILFKLGSVVYVDVRDSLSLQALNITGMIGSQSANSIANVSRAMFVNITKDNTEIIINASGYANETFTYALTQNSHNFSFNMSLPINALKPTFYDEFTEELITGESFSIFLAKPGFSQTFGGLTSNPDIIKNLDSGVYDLKVSSTNYEIREYKDITITNSTTTEIDLYLINNTIGDQVTFTVQGSGGEKLDGATLDFFRLINGSSTLVAQEETDFAGQATLSLDPNNEYDIHLARESYISRNISLEPTETEYTIILLTGIGAIFKNSYEGVRFRFYLNGIRSPSPPNILNITNTTQNITFEVEGNDLLEIGINFTNHGYTCTPASCSTTLGGEGNVTVGIFLNETGTFNTGYYFQKSGEKKIYVNDGLIKVIPFIFASLNSLTDFVQDMKGELSPNLRTLIVAMINVIAVGVGASLGLAGTALIIPVLAINIIASLPEIGLIHPFIGMIISIFGVSIYVYSQMR